MSILELQNVSKHFGGICAADKISLDLDGGRITALIGPNGAGKTSVFNIIGGFLKPDSGAVYYRGRDITGLAPWRIARLGIGRMFQDVRVFARLKVKDNVMAAFKGQRGESALASVIARRGVMREEQSLARKAMELLEFVSLADKAEDLAENLSFGEQKLLSMARLLAADADVFLLDEPTAGINPQRIDSILRVIREVALGGKTVVIIEHNMSVVAEITGWVYFMDEGRVILRGLPGEVLGDPEVKATYMGLYKA
jgi:branched-chain amino acid transport system ATP-binding protein/branched-chain amino acid transport system permease protein